MPFPVSRRLIRGVAIVCLLTGFISVPPMGGDTETPEFAAWLEELRREALSIEISTETLDAALRGVEPLERVIALDRKQPEFNLTLHEYVEHQISPLRIKRGRSALSRDQSLLRKIRASYGVQPRFVVALWGVESSFGDTTGGFKIIDALATLAHDGRRASFFRAELLSALRILDGGHVEPAKMHGSWAGAMGQPQFMPSSFLHYAVDFDGDQRKDIWDSRADVLASVANYLSSFGWHDDQTWGREVRLPAKLEPSLFGRGSSRSLPEWQALGLRQSNGSDLPTRPLEASLIRPDPEGKAYLVYDNFDTLMRWNRSEYFGIAVGLLSDRIGER